MKTEFITNHNANKQLLNSYKSGWRTSPERKRFKHLWRTEVQEQSTEPSLHVVITKFYWKIQSKVRNYYLHTMFITVVSQNL